MARIRNKAKSIAPVKKIWSVAAYIRLSREDGNDESLSVTNQKKILREYLEQFFEGEHILVDYYIDDGLTGTDYDRPDFQRMLRDVETGKVNCILCKNLSRMFRNYSDQGYFLEKVFPTYRTRFITVSDPKVDSYLHPETIEGLEVPINGLMNDRFAAKTSHDVRDTFATKRRKGEFIGAFAPYGYAKDPGDKNHLILDEEAAAVVRDIFCWFVYEGMSINGIAKKLNDFGIPSPAAYKRSKGLHFCCPQMKKIDGLWSACSVRNILKNRMYIGTMVQGRQTVINYKVHNKVAVPEENWYVVENTHQPAVDRMVFEQAQSLMLRDTRTAPQKREVHLLAGFVRCADCGKSMTRQKTKGIVYYYCRTYRDKSKLLCTKHAVKEEILMDVLLLAIQKQIALIGDMSQTVESALQVSAMTAESSRLNTILKLREKELNKVTNIIDCLYGDWKSGEISRDEYRRLKSRYESQARQLVQSIGHIQQENEALSERGQETDSCLADFLKYRNIKNLQRSILVALVKNVFVHAGGEIEIEFNFSDPYQHSQENEKNSLSYRGRLLERGD